MTGSNGDVMDVLTLKELNVDVALAIPSYTTAQRDALTNLFAGSLIFNSTTSKLNFYTGSAWEAVTSA